MCRRVTCNTCHGITWSGCGQHVDQVMSGIPAEAKCVCAPEDKAQGFFNRLFGIKG